MQVDDCLRYKSSSQNNLAFDSETQENMVSAQVSENSQDIFY